MKTPQELRQDEITTQNTSDRIEKQKLETLIELSFARAVEQRDITSQGGTMTLNFNILGPRAPTEEYISRNPHIAQGYFRIHGWESIYQPYYSDTAYLNNKFTHEYNLKPLMPQ